jgi:Protein of unknown function (DUF2867)
MSEHGPPRARRIPVPIDEPVGGRDRYDYADAFEIRVREPDARSAEMFTRHALEQAPSPVRWTIWIAQRYVLRLRLGPRTSPDHILGWKIVSSQPDVVRLEAESWLLRGVLMARRVDPTCARITTYVFYRRRAAARFLWKIVGPLHRRIARYLLEHAAATANRAPGRGARAGYRRDPGMHTVSSPGSGPQRRARRRG